jgi:hypothetical protein
MATVACYTYHKYDLQGFLPGQVRNWRYGPFDWGGKAVVATAHPFNLSTDFRTLTVTETSIWTTPNQPVADQYLGITIRNVGRDPITIYQVALGVIGP